MELANWRSDFIQWNPITSDQLFYPSHVSVSLFVTSVRSAAIVHNAYHYVITGAQILPFLLKLETNGIIQIYWLSRKNTIELYKVDWDPFSKDHVYRSRNI